MVQPNRPGFCRGVHPHFPLAGLTLGLTRYKAPGTLKAEHVAPIVSDANRGRHSLSQYF